MTKQEEKHAADACVHLWVYNGVMEDDAGRRRLLMRCTLCGEKRALSHGALRAVQGEKPQEAADDE